MQNAPSLAGFNPRELDEHAQRKMLDFVRNPASTKNANLSSQPVSKILHSHFIVQSPPLATTPSLPPKKAC